jgi:hypothetical protein
MASTAPRGSREPGSPLWCYQTMNLMSHSYQGLDIDHKRFVQYLAELREHKAWEKVPIEQPYGSETKMLEMELGKRIDEIEVEIEVVGTAFDRVMKLLPKLAPEELDECHLEIERLRTRSANA